MTVSHYHTAYGLHGYGPGDSDSWSTDTSLINLADSVGTLLTESGDGLMDDMTALRDQARGMRGSDPRPKHDAETWRQVADAALDALEAEERASDMHILGLNLEAAIKHADDVRVRRYLFEGVPFPMSASMGGTMIHVWECMTWECLVNEHDMEAVSSYQAQGTVGAYGAMTGRVWCICRDCMADDVHWSSDGGVAPYCDGCRDAGCSDRLGGECDRDDQDGE